VNNRQRDSAFHDKCSSFAVLAIYVAAITGVTVVPVAAHVGQGSRVTFTVSVANTGLVILLAECFHFASICRRCIQSSQMKGRPVCRRLLHCEKSRC